MLIENSISISFVGNIFFLLLLCLDIRVPLSPRSMDHLRASERNDLAYRVSDSILLEHEAA